MRITTSKTRFCGIITLMLISLGTLKAQVTYVSQDSTGSGSSWQDATGDLRAALASAEDGDEIWISGGTYTPTNCSPCSFADRDMRFVLPKGVKLRGGFNGTETVISERNSAIAQASQVNLSGQIETGVDTTRSFTVLETIAPTPGTLIEGITFEHGLANDTTRGTSSRGASGALIYVTTYNTLESINLEINHCLFQEGQCIGYGGAVFLNADFQKTSQLQIADCDFTNNSAETGGGAMTISSSFGGWDNSQITQTDFNQNTSGNEGGGGLLIRAAEQGRSTASFTSIYFGENSSPTGDGGGLRLYGKSGDCSPTFSFCDIVDNDAFFGGGLTIEGGFEGVSNPVFTNCDFSRNESGNAGGAIFASAIFGGTANFEIHQSSFNSNLSGESGGAVLVNAIEGTSRALYRDVEFLNNKATLYGGAVYNLGKAGVCSPTLINCTIASNEGSSAGGMYCLGSEGGESSPLILNCVFADNSADVGGGLYSNGNDSTGTAEPIVVNTVFQGNEAANGRTLRIIHARPQLINCYFDDADCESLNSGFGGEPVCLGGNIFGDGIGLFDDDTSTPMFNPLPTGPLVDAGNDSMLIANQVFTDFLRDARFRGMSADIGVIENAGDGILWKLETTSPAVSACEGASVTLGASIYPPYPTGAFSWTKGTDTVGQGASYTINELATSQAIQVNGLLFGETRSVSVAVTAIPTIITSLTSDVSSLPDTLCSDSTYHLRALVNAPNAAYDVQWLDENGTLLSNMETLTISPTTDPSISRKAVVEFTGTCLDTNSRSETFNFDVTNCMVSSTRQATDIEGLTVYPNPASDNIRLDGLSPNGQYNVQIHASTGQTVYSGTVSASNTTLNVFPLPQGLYILIVRDEQTIYRVLLEKL